MIGDAVEFAIANLNQSFDLPEYFLHPLGDDSPNHSFVDNQLRRNGPPNGVVLAEQRLKATDQPWIAGNADMIEFVEHQSIVPESVPGGLLFEPDPMVRLQPNSRVSYPDDQLTLAVATSDAPSRAAAVAISKTVMGFGDNSPRPGLRLVTGSRSATEFDVTLSNQTGDLRRWFGKIRQIDTLRRFGL